jgi:hypothetical protein
MTTVLLASAVTISVYLVLRVIGAIVSDEAKGWLPYLGRRLLRSAVRRLPARESSRWAEEWAGEFAAKLDRPVTALVFALRVRLHARATAAELQPTPPETESSGIDAVTDGAEPPRLAVLIDGRNRYLVGKTLDEALKSLSYRERRVLELLYGLFGERARGPDEVGRTFKVTPERIREIEGYSLKTLHSLAEAQKLRDRS